MLQFLVSVSYDIIEDQHDKLLQLTNALDLLNEDAGYIPLDHYIYRMYDCLDFLEGALESLKLCIVPTQNDKCTDSENK